METKSKCQYANEVHRHKNSHIEDDLILIFKKTTSFMTHTAEVIVRTIKPVRNISSARNTSTVGANSVRNTSTVRTKYQYSKNEFSQKNQYNRSEFSQK